MNETNILISIRQCYFDSIVSGEKTVELRRRAPRVQSGSRIWLYCKSPTATVSAVCRLDRIETMDRSKIWERHAEDLAITKCEFDNYLSGADSATALIIADVELLDNPIHLEAIRSLKSNFQPPQFFMHLRKNCALTNRLLLEIA